LCNVRSIKRSCKWDPFVCEVENAVIRPSLIAITETWLSAEVVDALRYVNGFDLYRGDRKCGIGGGIALYVSNVVFSSCVVPVNCVLCELLCVDCFVKTNLRTAIRCIVYYRPPKQCLEEMQEFCDHIMNLRCTDKQMLIMGDFNLPDINWNLYSSTVSYDVNDVFLDTLFDLNLYQFVHVPTRGENTLDLILSNCNDNIDNVTACEPISDHYIVSADIDLNVAMSTKVTTKTVRDFSKGDYDAFNVFLSHINWYQVFTSNVSVESRWAAFLEIVNAGIEKYIPVKTASVSNRTTKYPAYIRRLLMKKRRKWSQYNAYGDTQVLRDYKCVRKELKRELRKWRSNYEHTILNSCSVKKLYRYANSKMKCPISPVALLRNGNVMSDTSAAEAFNAFFGSVYVQDDGNLPAFEARKVDKPFDDNVNFSVVTVSQVIANLSSTHSCGPDGLSSFMLKQLKDNVSLPLSMIFHQSYNSGCIPDMWKRAIVCPIYKGNGAKMNVENYRPISLTCVCCKVMESIVTQSLLTHLQVNKLLTSVQHGFLSKRYVNSTVVMLQ
jgi:hypothetical protein